MLSFILLLLITVFVAPTTQAQTSPPYTIQLQSNSRITIVSPSPSPLPTVTPTPTPTNTPTPSPTPVASALIMGVPANGDTVSGVMNITYSGTPDIGWINLFIDNNWVHAVLGQSGGFTWDMTTVRNGQHTIMVHGYAIGSHVALASASVSVIVANGGPSPSPTPQPVPSPTPTPGPTAGCESPGMTGLPFMTDAQAAVGVKQTPLSKVETSNAIPPMATMPSASGTIGDQNANANSFAFNNFTTPAYQAQLAGFHQTWAGDPYYSRVTGDCRALGPSPTTAMIAQWAAHKWGFSPLIAYAEGTNDGHWDITNLGDFNCSVGPTQVSYCSNAQKPNHAIRGLDTSDPGHYLPAENTCFGYDIFMASLLKRQPAPGCTTISGARLQIAQWLSPGSCENTYEQRMCNSVVSHDWEKSYFGGQKVPY